MIALIVAGLTQWRRIEGWFGGRRTAWAGFVGALAATLAGTLANDSGALLLMIGAGALRGDRRRRLGHARGAPFSNLLEPPGPVT